MRPWLLRALALRNSRSMMIPSLGATNALLHQHSSAINPNDTPARSFASRVSPTTSKMIAAMSGDNFVLVPPIKTTIEEGLFDYLLQTKKYGKGLLGIDFDGTIVQTKGWMTEALDKVCNMFDMPKLFEDMEPQKRQTLIKLALYKSPQEAFTEIFGKEKWSLAYDEYKQTYNNICTTNEPILMPGVKELFSTIEGLKKDGLNLHCFISSHSNQEILDIVIAKFPEEIRSQIEHYHGSEESKNRNKQYQKPHYLSRFPRGKFLPQYELPIIYYGDGVGDVDAGGENSCVTVIRRGALFERVVASDRGQWPNVCFVDNANEFTQALTDAGVRFIQHQMTNTMSR